MDASLALYPLPDLVVVGDPSKPFEIQHHGCTVVNTVLFHSIRIQNDDKKDLNFPFNLFYFYFLGFISEVKVYVQGVRSIVKGD